MNRDDDERNRESEKRKIQCKSWRLGLHEAQVRLPDRHCADSEGFLQLLDVMERVVENLEVTIDRGRERPALHGYVIAVLIFGGQ